MADRFAIANGNFNSTSIWSTTPTGAGGASIPIAGDIAVANTRTITVTGTVICDQVRNDSYGGATATGTFSLAAGSTLSANAIAGGINLITYSGIVNTVANFFGSLSTLNVTGNGASIIGNTGAGTLNITGDITAGTGNNIGGNGIYGVGCSSGVVNISGNIIGGAGASNPGVIVTGGRTTITGNVSGGAGGGNANVTSYGASNRSGSGTLEIFGTAFGGTGSSGAHINTSTGILYVTKVVGNAFGLGSTGIGGVTVGLENNNQNAKAYVEQVEFGPRGATPITGPVYILPSNRNTLTGYTTAFGQSVTFYNSLSVSNLLPPASSVRQGTVYNVGNSTGTMAVPSASAVQFGVPVDNTVGTAALTPQSVWGYSRLSATEVDSMGDRLRNTATTQSVGYQIASFNL